MAGDFRERHDVPRVPVEKVRDASHLRVAHSVHVEAERVDSHRKGPRGGEELGDENDPLQKAGVETIPVRDRTHPQRGHGPKRNSIEAVRGRHEDVGLNSLLPQEL